jgi:uncharacterized Rmd1/YagE family protein
MKSFSVLGRPLLAFSRNSIISQQYVPSYYVGKFPRHCRPFSAAAVSSAANIDVLPNLRKPPLQVPPNAPEPSKGVPVTIKAYYISRGINISNISASQVYKSSNRFLQPRSITITLNEELKQYITVFQYGSVVFFNIPDDQHREHLKGISQHALVTSTIPFGKQPTEAYRVIIHEHLEKPSVIKSTHLNIRSLDMNNISIVGTIMAETVALDYYAMMVDNMLHSFLEMNSKIQSTGNMDGLSAKELHQLVASNNIVITNVLSKVSILYNKQAIFVLLILLLLLDGII